ncbi:MAG: polysaccharide biosynthesis protein [Bacillota bacterium]
MTDYIFIPAFLWVASYFFFGIYKKLWRYASLNELVVIITSNTAGLLVNMGLAYTVYSGGLLPIPRSVLVIWWILNIFAIGGSRLMWRIWVTGEIPMLGRRTGLPVVIYGAGNAGAMVAKELHVHKELDLFPVGFIDDDETKKDMQIAGLRVLGDRKELKEIVKKYGIEQVILALPKAGGKTAREIVRICEGLNVKVKVFPGIYSMINGNVSVKTIREVQIEDLLGREEAKLDLDKIKGYITGKTVLVTGAGGSIGSEISRQIMKFSPGRILLLGKGENSIYDITIELSERYKEYYIRPVIADIRDEPRIKGIFNEYRPDVVYHAAAHKHVPLMEDSPEEALKNNVLGTLNLARAASSVGTRTFVLISTDKAVNPSNIMGATKSISETIISYYNSISDTDYAAVRFGNVLGSRGSVLPLFRKQIEKGGPVTVTHPDMIRYFMTISEAAQLVIQSGALASGGEIFVLDMGDPVKIVELAETLIRLSGLEPGKDIEIVFTGVRPGEKLSEELTAEWEDVIPTENERIFLVKPQAVNCRQVESLIENIEKDIYCLNDQRALEIIRAVVPDYKAGEQCFKEIFSQTG